MTTYYRISAAALLLGICTKTIRRWDAAGKIECKRTLGGHRRISLIEIERLLTPTSNTQNSQADAAVAIYCRVSSHDQKKKGDLDRQIDAAQEFCQNKQITPRYSWIETFVHAHRTEKNRYGDYYLLGSAHTVRIRLPEELFYEPWRRHTRYSPETHVFDAGRAGTRPDRDHHLLFGAGAWHAVSSKSDQTD